MSKSLVIVESPAKAKTISKYLGKDFTVEASVGHIKDLPKNKIGVDLSDGSFAPELIVIPGKEKVVDRLKKLAKSATTVYLAPDPDREGEAIAWHIADQLGKIKGTVRRVLLHEITQGAVGLRRRSFFSTFATDHLAFSSAATTASICCLLGRDGASTVSTTAFSPSMPVKRAVNSVFSLTGVSCASRVQYSTGTNALISRSRSTMSRRATVCTRPAERPRRTLSHSSGEIW